MRTKTLAQRRWTARAGARALAACALGLALPVAARAATTFTLLASSAWAHRVAGPDLLVGTADDPTPPALPGDDGIPGTADDVFANPAGATSYLRFAQLPLGGDYDVFATGSFGVQSWTAGGSSTSTSDFALVASTAQTNGLTGTLVDSGALPHVVSLDASGALSGTFTFHACVTGGGSCVDLLATLGGGAILRAPGRDDAASVPGLTPAQADYLNQLKAIAPSGWTQIWLLLLAPTTLDATNVSGPTAPFLIGGSANAVLALATTDPLVAPADDPDGDGIPTPADNCPFTANPGQEDRGGVGASSGPDGIGDACQCGDVNGDGRVTLVDALLVSRSLLRPPTAVLPHPELCDVGGAPSPASQNCTVSDAVLIRRALVSPPTATISQSCAPALP